jgi:ABC-type Na+ efflux pump permease subunit
VGRIENQIGHLFEEAEKREVRKVAKVKKVAKPEAEEAEEAPKSKKAKGNGKVSAKPDKSEKKGKAEKASPNRGPQEVPEGYVGIAELASEAEITAQSARVKLRSSDIERPDGRWLWPAGSKGLKKAREILGL